MILRYYTKWLIAFYIIAFLMLGGLLSCSTSELAQEQESEYNCPSTVWKYWANAEKDAQADWFAEQGARRGCIRYYGPGACLVSMTKTGRDSYYAICRRKM